ncbi:MAG TPA: aminotransferase class I/II-fold pyridoxal phosphate-dependent enzyme [Chthoniobacterales bacterium]|nr:aminotransferase class I/II-fold pyridoxal phosphate-dependent enzyme [Chthoniobacterales bacterium]
MTKTNSEFMHWAKTRQKVKYDLALSGILNLPIAKLDVKLSDLELHGDNAYGYRPLIEALAKHRQVAPENVVTVSGGTSMANHLAMAALLEHGDDVLIEQPTYDPLLAIAEYLGTKIKRFARRFEDGFKIDIVDLEKQITPRTRLIVLTNLHNPSSALVDEATLREVGEMARNVGAKVLVDEVYLEAMFKNAPASAISFGPEFVITSSLTKGYGLSGLRCGWIFAEAKLAEKIRRLDDIFAASAPNVMERLSVLALNQLPKIAARAGSMLEANRQVLNNFFKTRDDIEPAPTKFGTTSFPRLRHVDADQLCALLIEKYEAAVVPGRFFESPSHIRIGMCCEPTLFNEGVERLGKALDELRR